MINLADKTILYVEYKYKYISILRIQNWNKITLEGSLNAMKLYNFQTYSAAHSKL
jgi:hypothetical protein